MKKTIEVKVLTTKGRQVVPGKFYKVKFRNGKSLSYGYSWINPQFPNSETVDIIVHNGGVTVQNLKDVFFIQQLV